MDGLLVKQQDNTIHIQGHPDQVLHQPIQQGGQPGEQPEVQQPVQQQPVRVNRYLGAMQEFDQGYQELDEKAQGVHLGDMVGKVRRSGAGTFTEIKTLYQSIKTKMEGTIPTEQEEFNQQLGVMTQNYRDLVDMCDNYVSANWAIRKLEGESRLGLIRGIRASAKAELKYLQDQGRHIYAKITRDAEHPLENAVWGNVLGDMQGEVRHYANIQKGMAEKFGKKSMTKEGMKTFEIMKLFRAGQLVKESDPQGEVLLDSIKDFLKDNKTPALTEEFKEFRSFVKDRLGKFYQDLMNRDSAPPWFIPEGQELNAEQKEQAKTQYAKLMVQSDKFYQYWTIAKALEETLELGPEEAQEWESAGEMETYALLDSERVRKTLTDREGIDRVDAKKTLGEYLTEPDQIFIQETLGTQERMVQKPTKAYHVKRPMAQKAGGVAFDEKIEKEAYETREQQAQQRIEGKLAGDDFKKFHDSFGDDDFWNVDLKNVDGSSLFANLTGKTVLLGLKGIATEDQTRRVFTKLFSGRKKLLEKAAKNEEISEEEKAQVTKEIEEGKTLLMNLVYLHLRKMEETYGRLVGQMHPEDVYRQYGDELFEHFHSLETLKPLIEWVKNNGNAFGVQTAKQSKFKALATYFMNVHQRMKLYFTDQEHFDDADGPVQQLESQGAYRDISGPSMTIARLRTYRRNVNARFGLEGAHPAFAGRTYDAQGHLRREPPAEPPHDPPPEE